MDRPTLGSDMHHELQTLADPDAVARAGAVFVAERARAAVAANGSFHFAVSGGHTPWAMFAELASETVPWDATVIYQVDERVAPPDDPDRNLTHLTKALGSAPAQVRPMPVNESDLVAAAASYAACCPSTSILSTWVLAPTGTPPRWSRAIRSCRSPIAWSPSPSRTRSGYG
jgi:6-phosphogluconolactonase